MISRLQEKHTLMTRWTHWVNFPVLAMMIWSGLLIYWANDVYSISLFGVTLFHFFPDWFYNVLGLGHRLAEGMAWHFAVMWLFAVNGVLYVGYTVFSGEWRELVPDRRGARTALSERLETELQVLLHGGSTRARGGG